MYTRKSSSPLRWLAELLAVSACAIFGALYFALVDYIDRPIVMYDEDALGERVCTQVEVPNGVRSCASFTKEQLDSFEWVPALSIPR